jgi:DNA-binding MarR family transcriptional regulator
MVENRISFLLNDLVREMNGQADSLLRGKFGLTYSQFVFLLILLEKKEIDVTRLAEALGVTKGAVSKRIGWFLERDLVSTYQSPGDAKRVLTSLTPVGIKLAKSAGDFLEQRFLATITRSQEFDQELLRNELQKMLQLLLAKH